MAVLRVELEIDSDVYPELYLKLASLGRASAREEKLRQLAAHGLVWEIARLHGPAVFEVATPAVMDLGVDAPVVEAEPEVTGAVADVRDELDVDLALDAPAADPRPDDEPLVELPLAEPPHEVLPPLSREELPVLLDVVVEAEAAPMVAAVGASTPAPMSPPVSSPLPPRASPRAPTPRSARSARLARMKQRGLFQNE